MTKNAFDTETKGEAKKRGQFAKSAKVKKEHSNGQGTDSQPEVKVEKDEWFEPKKVQRNQCGYEVHNSQGLGR